jgi:hypothetical protein
MLEFLTLQVFANILGIASIGAADWLYIRGRLRRRLHSLWVAFSSTAICLPVVTWTVSVFLGIGMASLAVIGTLDAIMFFWIYYNCKKVPSLRKVRSALAAPRPSSAPIPPSSPVKT